jgi:hypothetical protein
MPPCGKNRVSPGIKGLVFNVKEQRVRGSFMLFFLTLCIVALIFIGAFNDRVSVNLQRMEAIILGLFGISFGVWEAKKYLEGKNRGENRGDSNLSDP